MATLAVAAQVVVVVEAEVAAVAVEGEAMVVAVMAPVRRAGVGTAIIVGSLDISLVTATLRSPRRRRKNRPLRPRKKSPPSCLWWSTPLRRRL
jgi:hypothetical protein